VSASFLPGVRQHQKIPDRHKHYWCDGIVFIIQFISAELERLRIELTEQKSINQSLIAENDEAHKQTAITREETTMVAGQLEATKASTTELKQVLSGRQKGTKNQEIDSRKCQLPNPNPEAYRFNK